jgi:chemotaxis protein CheD
MRLAIVQETFLRPGEHFVGGGGRVRTLLGSCVSVTLWHPHTRTGAMSHFLLWSRGGVPVGGAPDGRYGDEALRLMLSGLARRGINHLQCQAKVFGGGNMFSHVAVSRMQMIGESNGQQAHAVLAQLGIKVVSQSLFGDGYRRICFDVRTGDVLVSHVQATDMPVSEGVAK